MEFPVHVFPTRMDGAAWGELQRLHPEHAGFWSELQPVYDVFEGTKRVPRVEISSEGAYRLASKLDGR